jgi:CubicO group peptidase (beta-lactamase class C family)
MKRRPFLALAGAGVLGMSKLSMALARTGIGESESELDPQFDDICRLIEAKMAEYRTTGVAFAISRRGVSRTRGFGVTNLDNPQPVTADTVGLWKATASTSSSCLSASCASPF